MRIHVILFIGLFIFCGKGYAQQNRSDSSQKIFRDSIQHILSNKFGTTDTGFSTMLNSVERYNIELNQIISKLKKGYDTLSLTKDLEQIEREANTIFLILDNTDENKNLRTLYGCKVLLLQLKQKLEKKEKSIQRIDIGLNRMRASINAIRNDSFILKLPKDTALLPQHFTRISELFRRYRNADTLLRKTNAQIGLIQNRVVKLSLGTIENKEAVDAEILQELNTIAYRDAPNIWASKKDSLNTIEIFKKSLKGSLIIIPYFFDSSWGVRVFVLAIFILLFVWIRINKKRLVTIGGMSVDADYYSTWRFPLLSALHVGLCFLPILHNNPPLFYLQSIWLAGLFTFSILIWPTIDKEGKWLLISTCLLFCFFSTSSILYKYPNSLRWGLLLACFATLYWGYCIWQFAIVKHKWKGWETGIKVLIGLMFTAIAGSIIANVFGRIILARLLGQAGFYALLIGANVHLMVRILLQAFALHADAHRVGSRFLFSLNEKKLFKYLTQGLTVFGIIAWVIMVLKNITLFDFLYEDVNLLLTSPIHIGSSSFTIGSIAIFFLVLWISMILSQLASFLLGSNHEKTITKNRFNSLLIFLRLGLLGGGVLLAFAASGITLDKLTIVLGALSVGIGFGLQNIVNNLVSGVILAFEKPVQVGDVIEVGERTGTVREIGIRSSKILTYEGAEVIVPNGDLISHQIINWTLSNNHKRLEVIVGVRYGTDLALAQAAIKTALNGHPDLLPYPEPAVYTHNFSASSVDFRVLFWCNMNSNFLDLKSNVIMRIHVCLAEAGIEIPFPQQDVYIKEIPGSKAV